MWGVRMMEEVTHQGENLANFWQAGRKMLRICFRFVFPSSVLSLGVQLGKREEEAGAKGRRRGR